jgi:hypothetical protein
LADLQRQYKKYIHKRPKHILLCLPIGNSAEPTVLRPVPTAYTTHVPLVLRLSPI